MLFLTTYNCHLFNLKTKMAIHCPFLFPFTKILFDMIAKKYFKHPQCLPMFVIKLILIEMERGKKCFHEYQLGNEWLLFSSEGGGGGLSRIAQ